jgi:four helix bundle protein
VASQADQLRERVKSFARRVLMFVKTLPGDPATIAVARQLARCGPSVSANYHSSGGSRSRAEFIARLGTVVDEADETVGWLELLKTTASASGPELDWLLDESMQLRAIFVRSVTTARSNHKRRGDKAQDV